MRNDRLARSARLAAAWLAALAVAAPALGQAVRGTLLGNVTDASGLALPGATVTITEVRTNLTYTTTTNESGNYVFSNLRDGEYRVEAELAGFKKAVRSGVKVDVNTTVRVDLRLEVGALEETVTVVGESPLLQTDRTDTGRTIPAIQVRELPLGFNRNFQNLWVLVPGASRPYRPHSEFFNPQDSLATNVNGQSRLANNVMIEGVDNNHKTGLLTVLIPSAEAIEAVNVTTSNYDAEFGRAGGAVTVVTLRSGTNQLRGSLFAFGNTEATIARGYFSRQKAPTEYLQAGFTLGGPIRRDRLFFFGDFQHTLDHHGRIQRAIIPPMDFRRGDFSRAPTTIYDPATGNPDGTGRRPFAGNQIPADRISPIARRILAVIPEPNIPDAAPGQINFQMPYVRAKTTRAFDTKINHRASGRDDVSVRLSYQRPEITDPGIYGIYGGGGKDFAGRGTNVTISTGATWTRTWSSTLLSEVRGGVSYYHNEAVTDAHGLRIAEELGIRGVNLDDYTSGPATISIAGFSNPIVGFSASLPWDRSERTIQVAATVTKLRGDHTIKVGADVRHNRDFLLQTQDRGGPRGIFTFSGAQTAIPADARAVNGFANAFAAFLLDVPSSAGRDLKVIRPGTRHAAVFTFVHDKWQIRPDVTIDLGLRHEFYTPLVGLESRGGLSNYDPETNTLRVAGYGEVPANLGVRRWWWNFSPRTGISWRPTERSVVRAGYGVSTIPFPDNSYAFNFPVKQNNVFTPPNSFAPSPVRMADGFPPPIVAEIPSSGIIPASTPEFLRQGFFHVPLDLREAALHSWNVAYQRELAWGLTAEIAYVGNRGSGIVTGFNMNAGMELGADRNGRPLFRAFGREADTNTWIRVKTQYHSLQMKLDRRFADGFMVTTSYTIGRAWNYSQGDTNGAIGTPADIERSWGRASFDRLHTFAQSVIVAPPVGRGRRWLSRGPAAWILGDWQVAAIIVLQSGTPIDFTASAATLRAPGNTQRPNASGRPRVLGEVGPDRLWFDTSVFSAPEQNTWGNVRRNALLDGPGYYNVDMTLAKRIPLGRAAGEFRVDAFNVFNIPHFSNPSGSFGSANFGRVTAAFGERVVRFGLRVEF
ncbi:MAG TPA: carboxypeptidase regulatory-like domain-containing protein [Vicinamibacterales bacterium]|nr:carboxypeptidase regulatory-like domain-containing protein [Vicinamibacterales bacterium]